MAYPRLKRIGEENVEYKLIAKHQHAQRRNVYDKALQALFRYQPEHPAYCKIAAYGGNYRAHYNAAPIRALKALRRNVRNLEHKGAEYCGYGQYERILRRRLFRKAEEARAGDCGTAP